jgi:hypothetical protein
MAIYAASFVIVWEHRWFDPPTDPTLQRRSQWEPDGTHITKLQAARSEREWVLETALYEAADADAAFDWATRLMARPVDMIRGDMSDLSVRHCTGIHDIEEILQATATLGAELRSDLGVDVASVSSDSFGANGWPLVRHREQLSIFR